MTGDNKLPGYRGELGRDVVTIAEALGTGGYRRYMSGKWHVTKHAASGSEGQLAVAAGIRSFTAQSLARAVLIRRPVPREPVHHAGER